MFGNKKANEITTLTGFSGCDMAVHLEKGNEWGENFSGIAYGIQAIQWSTNIDGKINGSIVLWGTPNPTPGPQQVVITCNGEDDRFAANVIHGMELIDNETGEDIAWEDTETAKVYGFVAQGQTGWIKK